MPIFAYRHGRPGGRSVLAVVRALAALWLIVSVPCAVAQIEPLGILHGQKTLQAQELRMLLNTKQISQEEYKRRYDSIQAQLRLLEQQIARRPADQQARIRAASREYVNNGMPQLRERERQYRQQLAAQQAEARRQEQLARQQEREQQRLAQQAERERQLQAQREQQLAAQRAREQAAQAERQRQQQLQQQQLAAQQAQQQQAAAREAQRRQQLEAQQRAQQQARTAQSATQQAGAATAGAAAAAPAVQFTPPPEEPESEGRGWLWSLLVIPVGGAAYFFWVRRKRTGELLSESGSQGGPRRRSPPTPAARSAAPAAAASSTAHVAPAARPTGGTFKDQLFAQQKNKYQAGLNAVADELTQIQITLQEHSGTPEALRKSLREIGATLYKSTRELIQQRHKNHGKALVNALLLMPLWRAFRAGGWLVKLIVLAGLAMLVKWAFELLMHGYSVLAPILLYLTTVVPVFFVVEWLIQRRGPLKLFERNSAHVRFPSLHYVYGGQQPQIENGATTVRALDVWSAQDKKTLEENTVALQNFDAERETGTCYLSLGELGMYQIEVGCDPVLQNRKQANEFVKTSADLVDEVVSRHADAFDPLIEQLRAFGDLRWRERSRRAEVPRLENLLRNVERMERIWQPVVVTQPVLEFLMRRIDLFNLRDKATPAGILLYGYPGNGKEFLARKVAESVMGAFVKVTAEQLSSARSVRDLWKTIGEGSVLFVEHADQIFAKPGADNDGGSREGVLAWIEEWSRNDPVRGGKWVIMSARSDQALHPRILAQFGSSKIEITAPDAAARAQLLAFACAENEMPVAAPQWVVEQTGGATVSELREIVKETRLHSLPDPPTDEHWRAAVRTVRGSDAAFRDPSKTWDRLVLPKEVKDQLKRAARILREADRYKDKKVNIPNLLLYGPPGTGKTDIARTFANEGGVRFLAATTADLKGQYTGQSAHLVRDLFSRARGMAPCILFIDEIETVAAKRGSSSADSFTQEIVTEMLAQMEGAARNDRPVIVLAATNLPERIDDAILSRFTSRIEIPLPDEEGRSEILKRLLAERPCDPALDVEEVSAFLARRLPRRAGRDLVMLVQRAMERAVAHSDSPDDVKLTRELLIEEALPRGKEVSEEQLQKIWSQIVLDPKVKEDILDKIRMFNRADKAAPRGLLLYGPPGTGKTEVARRIAESASCHFMALSGPDLKAGHVGGSGERVQKIWEQARSRGRCVIFVDECEGVFARRGGTNSDSASEELVQAFLAQWDGVGTEGQQIWVVGATNRRELLDEAIVSRFGAAVEIGLPGAQERLQILKLEMAKLERTAEIPAFVGAMTTGMSGRTLSVVAREVCMRAARQGNKFDDALWRDVLKQHTKAGSEAVDERARWESLILPDETISKLKSLCESLRHAETLAKQGLQPPQGALLYGPPGTGKTQIARTLANESGLPFIAASTAEIKAGFTGQSGQKVRELFERARSRAPCILFIDEIDAVAAVRGGPNADTFTNEIVNQLLQEMDGVRKSDRHVFVLAATNLPESVDPAVRSRLKDQIEIPKPDAQQRQKLFRVLLAGRKCDFDLDEVAAELARRTNGASGRDITGIIERGAQRAIARAIAAGKPEEVVISREDLLTEASPQGKEVSEEQLQAIWSKIVLSPELKESILGNVRMFNRADKAAPRGLLLYGPPGTGKTEIARRIAESVSCHFMSLSLADLKSGYVGQTGTQVRKVWDQARARGRCVMFVDECEGAFARRGSTNADAITDELVQAFLAEWDGVGTSGQIWVIGATNRRELIDEAIVSRFGAAIEVGAPGANERREILRLEMEKLERSVEIPEFVATATTGFSGRNLAILARDVCTRAIQLGGEITPEVWKEVLGKHVKASSESVDAGARWDSLILPDETLEHLRVLCESLRHIETLKQQGFEVPRAALLYGPPGTGKTQIARTLANESGLPFIAATTAEIKAGFLGQSGQKVKELFERARAKSPSIVFIDEIETVVPARGGPGADQYTQEIVTQLLQELDGVRSSDRHVFLLAATNLPDAIDPAILSRFGEKIEIPNPDARQRERLIRVFLAKQRTTFDVDEVSREVAQVTANVSGRDLRAIVQRAAQKAVRRALREGTPHAVALSREDVLSSVPTAAQSGSTLQ